tara:strand:- start:494 stop:1027 length:534 start_codon:yes stop_codon:yes gene_type:complete
MGKILAQLEQMASSSSSGSSPGSSIGEFFSDTPSTVTDNIPIKAEAAGIADFGLSQAEMDEFGYGGITTDIGEEHDITISGGKQAGYKDVLDKIKEEVSKGGSGDGPVPVKPISGRLPPMPGVPAGRSSYRPTESPYGIPSELASQEALQQEISRRIAKQLEQTIVKRPYLNFQGLI